jgi:hypothetical protein
MSALASKSARVAALYIVLCALAGWIARREHLGLVTDARDAVIRELMRAPERADVLFLGSSQTARGLIPDVFDARSSELTGRPVRSVNLAPFGAGRHIGFLELEDWLATHEPPSTVVVEVGVLSDTGEAMHQMLPRFMDVRDARRAVRWRPYRYRSQEEMAQRRPLLVDPLGALTALDRVAMHLELALDVLGRGPEDCARAAFNWAVQRGRSPYWKPSVPELLALIESQVEERGYFRITPDSPDGARGKIRVREQAERVSFDEAVAKTWADVGEPDEFADPSRFLATRLYAAWTAEVCRTRGIRLVFVDMLNFRGRPLRPSQVDFYRSQGELFQPDKTVLYREASFQDPGHLSVDGATYLSRALAEFLAKR